MSEPTRQAAEDRALAHLSLRFVLEAAAKGMAELKTLDAILIMAVNQANIAPLTRDPQARTRYGALDAPAPDEERRPVSISAIAASLNLPYETARRRLRHLAGEGACTLSEAGAVVPQAFLGSPGYLESGRALHERLWAFYRASRALGMVGPLPASHYPVESGVPVRGAIRLAADYLLRSAETFVQHFGDLVAGLIGMTVLCEATAPRRPGDDERSIRNSAVAERLQMPVETVRRHALALVARGRLVRTSGGLSIPEPTLSGHELSAVLRENSAHVQRLFAGLAERGVIEAWERLRPTGAPTTEPLARA